MEGEDEYVYFCNAKERIVREHTCRISVNVINIVVLLAFIRYPAEGTINLAR